jgi:hypothetical protein
MFERLHSARLHSARALFLSLLIVGCAARLGYGVARYNTALTASGADFITRWDYDAIEHVLIAKSLIDAGEYRVASVPGLEKKHVRGIGYDGSFKAPLYQVFLAGVFAVSGYNFFLFFPLQALIGGIASGLVALIALETFHSRRAAVIAGLGAAIHPVLVNSASQPYNENLYVALIFGSVWSFLKWWHAPHLRWAVSCGALGALAILCRESAGSMVLALAGLALFSPAARWRQAIAAGSAILVVAGVILAPWLARNAALYGEPSVSSGGAHVVALGNNECLAREPLSQVYWADKPCPDANARRRRLWAALDIDPRNSALHERLDTRIGMDFIAAQPVDYVRLSVRRAWSMFLPFHPRQETGRFQRAVLLVYWLIFVPAGIIGVIQSVRAWQRDALPLAVLLAVATVPLVLVYFTPDGRHRMPADLLIACFAGYAYAQLGRGGSGGR